MSRGSNSKIRLVAAVPSILGSKKASCPGPTWSPPPTPPCTVFPGNCLPAGSEWVLLCRGGRRMPEVRASLPNSRRPLMCKSVLMESPVIYDES
eukprot:12236_1